MKDINFFEGVKKSAPQRKAASAIKICSISLVVVIILVGGLYAYLFITGKALDNKISDVKQQIDQLKNDNSGVSQVDAKKKTLEALISYTKQVQEFKTSVDVYPIFDEWFFNHILNKMPSDVRLVSMEYKDGVLKITALAKKSLSPALYAQRLAVCCQMEKINYSGNFIVSDESDMLQFTIECVLKGEQ
ncbi:MAG: hypothetical protein GYA50_04085 [Eubacteriaceae bacterium]|nr:hypothetical protein [Eubacteriaceae bacterium]